MNSSMGLVEWPMVQIFIVVTVRPRAVTGSHEARRLSVPLDGLSMPPDSCSVQTPLQIALASPGLLERFATGHYAYGNRQSDMVPLPELRGCVCDPCLGLALLFF